MKLVIIVPFLLLTYILQAAVFSRVLIFGAKPLLLPIAVSAVALFEGSVKGGIFGIFAGILCDISFNQPAVEFTLILTILGLAIGFLSEALLIKGFPSYFCCSLGTLIICAVCQTFSFLVFDGVSVFVLLTATLKQTLASIIFTIPIYYIVRFAHRAF